MMDSMDGNVSLGTFWILELLMAWSTSHGCGPGTGCVETTGKFQWLRQSILGSRLLCVLPCPAGGHPEDDQLRRECLQKPQAQVSREERIRARTYTKRIVDGRQSIVRNDKPRLYRNGRFSMNAGDDHGCCTYPK
jgi:hypothetical protein